MFKITIENFNEVAEVLFNGLKLFDNYNQECFGSSDVRMAYKARQCVALFEEGLKNAGYQSVTILDPIARLYGCQALVVEPYPQYRAVVDEDLYFEIPIEIERWYEQIKAYMVHVEKNKGA